MKIGIIGALEEEIRHLKEIIEIQSIETIALREYYHGILFGKQILLVYSGVGKVAAASTATTLIQHFGVDLVLFTGVAGGADKDLGIGDVVISNKLVQHDIDCTGIPGIQPFEIPRLNKVYFEVKPPLLKKAVASANFYISNVMEKEMDIQLLQEFGITVPKVVTGTIASGDQFVSDGSRIKALASRIDKLQCVDMEGAAVAQVCYEYSVDYIVFRVISDNADENARINFNRFIEKTAGYLTAGIIKRFVKELG